MRTFKMRNGNTAQVVFIGVHLDLMIQPSSEMCFWVTKSGKYYGYKEPYEMDILDYVSIEQNPIDECNKVALAFMADGKPKETQGALACAERFKKLGSKT